MRGFTLKEEVRANLAKPGTKVIDLGTYKPDPLDDYPDFAEKVGEAAERGDAPRGILICGLGVGVCVAANKMPGIRAGICHDTYSAHQGVEHDDMNVIVLGRADYRIGAGLRSCECVCGRKVYCLRRAICAAI